MSMGIQMKELYYNNNKNNKSILKRKSGIIETTTTITHSHTHTHTHTHVHIDVNEDCSLSLNPLLVHLFSFSHGVEASVGGRHHSFDYTVKHIRKLETLSRIHIVDVHSNKWKRNIWQNNRTELIIE